tara:strand:+ start:1363 stop:1857 length:495 start_codon:yes stop_codon:yes gene_type:complete
MNNTNTIVVMTPSQISFLRALIADGIMGCEFSRDDMRPTMIRLGLGWPPAWIVKDMDRRVSRGLYRVDEMDDVRALIAQETAEMVATAVVDAAERATTDFDRLTDDIHQRDAAERATTDFDRAMQTDDPPEYGYTMMDDEGTEFKCDAQGNPAPIANTSAGIGI